MSSCCTGNIFDILLARDRALENRQRKEVPIRLKAFYVFCCVGNLILIPVIAFHMWKAVFGAMRCYSPQPMYVQIAWILAIEISFLFNVFFSYVTLCRIVFNGWYTMQGKLHLSRRLAWPHLGLFCCSTFPYVYLAVESTHQCADANELRIRLAVCSVLSSVLSALPPTVHWTLGSVCCPECLKCDIPVVCVDAAPVAGSSKKFLIKTGEEVRMTSGWAVSVVQFFMELFNELQPYSRPDVSGPPQGGVMLDLSMAADETSTLMEALTRNLDTNEERETAPAQGPATSQVCAVKMPEDQRLREDQVQDT